MKKKQLQQIMTISLSAAGVVLLILVGLIIYLFISLQTLNENVVSLGENVSELQSNVAKVDSRLERAEVGLVTLAHDGFVEKPGLTPVARDILPSIVFILGTDTSYNEGDTILSDISTEEVRGTGFFVSSDGFIATARHVITGLNPNNVLIKDGENNVRRARVAAVGATTLDIALLKVDGKGFSAVEFGAFENIRIGDEIGFIGFNSGFNRPLVHGGNVSTIGLDENGAELFTINSFVNRGNSGSPVFSQLTGRVIGIVSSRKSEVLNRDPLDLSQISSGVSFGSVDPIRFSAEIYNETLKLVASASQVGIGVIYSTDELQKLVQ